MLPVHGCPRCLYHGVDMVTMKLCRGKTFRKIRLKTCWKPCWETRWEDVRKNSQEPRRETYCPWSASLYPIDPCQRSGLFWEIRASLRPHWGALRKTFAKTCPVYLWIYELFQSSSCLKQKIYARLMQASKYGNKCICRLCFLYVRFS